MMKVYFLLLGAGLLSPNWCFACERYTTAKACSKANSSSCVWLGGGDGCVLMSAPVPGPPVTQDGPTTISPVTPAPVSDDPEPPLSTSPGEPIQVTGGDTVSLLMSSAETLYTLSTQDGVPAGRSYDGHEWEAVYPTLLHYTCGESACSVLLPAGTYVLEANTPGPLTTDQEVSRFLMQATFGPTENDIASASSNVAQWLSDQISLPHTSHREHYRERANGRLKQGVNLFGTSDACAAGSRWNRFAFTKDDMGSVITTTTVAASGKVALQINGVTRTELDYFSPSVSSPFVICEVAEYVGGDLSVGTENGSNMKCDIMNTDTILNPAIAFYEASPAVDAILEDLSPSTLDTKLAISFPSGCALKAAGPLFVRDVASSSVYIHDKRFVKIDNTPGSLTIARNTVTKYCPSAPKTFLNQETCEIRPECSPPTWSSAGLQLTEAALKSFYDSSELYVYRVSGLRILDTQDSPCVGGIDPFRWTRRDSDNDATGCPGGDTILEPTIHSALINAITAAVFPDARALDVLHTDYACSDPSYTAIGSHVSVPGAGCWTHSHDDEWSVYDVSAWVILHPGNPEAFGNRKPNPIAKIAQQDEVTLHFPAWHPQNRWDEHMWRFAYVGNWYDTVDFASLNPKVQSPTMAALLGSFWTGWNENFEVCGSPGEVANEPSKGHQYNNHLYGDQSDVTETSLDQDRPNWFSKTTVWATIALDSPDQLRQRVAWALSQLFVVSTGSINLEGMTEPWTAYYDIFGRHAFGNFADILKEVSLSPLMGLMLTFLGSKSLAYSVEESGAMNFPDENFAREIMQLFSVGLWKLNPDGTQVLDEASLPIPTYDNTDITTFARGWTGLESPLPRGNLESEWNLEDYTANYIDPMRFMTKDARDVFPKLSLDDNGRTYMGDGIQRCNAMPKKAFLKKGATYRFLGHSSNSNLGRADPSWWPSAEGWNPRLVLSPFTSSLYSALCDADSSGNCQFQSYVVLDQNLACDGTCSAGQWGQDATNCECSIDEPRVVRFNGSTATGSSLPSYYEYVRQPCISMAFPDSPTYTVSEIHSGGGAICAEVSAPVASGACCDEHGSVTSLCVFQGERVSYDTAEQRCLDAGKTTCAWDSVPINWSCGTDTAPWETNDPKAGLHFTWTNSPCSVKAQINEQGNIAVVHDVAPLSKPVKGRVAQNAGAYFRVMWGGDASFPTTASGCSGCQVVGTTCLCDTQVSTTAIFSGFPTVFDVERNLRIGGADPTSFDANTYHACVAPTCASSSGAVVAYTTGDGPVVDDSQISFDEDTIFELLDPAGGPSKFFLNAESIVNVGEFDFRNPPMHGSIVDQAPRDAIYEIDAMLDQYVHHSNVAPFVATRLIQLLTTSNPSPRYVFEVSNAFNTGSYYADDYGMHFGAGEYGDMEALVAAVLLDRESRSITLDADAAHGRAREPILKVMHLFRSMRLGSLEEREVTLSYLRDKIGQEPHNAPSVFSFFLSDFSPVGPVYDKGLVSPESQLLDAPTIVGFFNGLASLPLHGLSECEWWEGLGNWNERYVLTDHPEEGRFDCVQNYDLNPGGISVPYRLEWTPSAWSAGFPSPDAVFTPFSLSSAPYCGCQDCTQDAWDMYSASSPENNYTCGARISWVDSQPNSPNGTAACSRFAGLEGVFPEVCGPACDPARCDMDKTAFALIAANVINELDTLLTGGRLESANRAIIEEAYLNEAARRDKPEAEAHKRALRKVQQLFAVTPEFHITNNLMDDHQPAEVRDAIVESLPESPAPVVGYKAIVYLYLDGAMDSYSALVPHSGCGDTNLRQQYQDVRGDVAIPLSDVHQITENTGSQPCSVFGLHPSLSHLQQLYNSADAAVIANVGPLVEPLTKAEYENEGKDAPPALFAHNTQKQITQTVFAQDSSAGGVLGRIGDEINAQESELQGEEAEIFDAYSISGTSKILEGAPGVSRVADVFTGYGVSGLVPSASSIESQIRGLNAHVAKSIFGETFSEKVSSTLNRIDLLGDTLGSVAITNSACFDNLNTDIARQFKTVAQVIAARSSLGSKRDVFYTSHGGYDTHSDNGPRLAELLLEVNNAVQCFTNELKLQGVWANVTVVTASEFGRTLTSNGQGTDHGWGGNHFVFGGSVKGGKILGKFPDDLTDSGPLNIGRGRLIPTTGWEAVWNALASWFGVSSSRMANVLPNLEKFPAQDIFFEADLFE